MQLEMTVLTQTV